MVQVGDDGAVDPAECLADRGRVGGGAGHRARILETEADHRQAAAGHQAQAVLVGHYSRGGGGRELSQAVPEDHVRGGAHPAQDRVQRKADGRHRGLAHLRLHEPALGLGTGDRRIQE